MNLADPGDDQEGPVVEAPARDRPREEAGASRWTNVFSSYGVGFVLGFGYFLVAPGGGIAVMADWPLWLPLPAAAVVGIGLEMRGGRELNAKGLLTLGAGILGAATGLVLGLIVMTAVFPTV